MPSWVRRSLDPCCSQEDMALRNFDFAPLCRSTIGFDRMMRLFDDATRMVDNGESSYPPYNIEKTGEESYRITMAGGGFRGLVLFIIPQANPLVIGGMEQGGGEGPSLPHRPAARPPLPGLRPP